MTGDDDYTADEIGAEEHRVERTMTVAEIFAAGFKSGLSHAGLQERPERPYRAWLAERLERRG